MFRRKKIKSKDERKERSDKKIHVGPTVSIKLKREIERLGVITDNPVKFIGEILCFEGIHTPEVIAQLAPHFQRRTIRAGKTVYFGCEENVSIQERTDNDESDRVSIRFTKINYEDIRLLADALDVTPSRATAILLDASIRYPAIIETILQEYNVRNSLDEVYTKEIRKLMRYVNRDNPYLNRTWNKTLTQIIEDVKTKAGDTRIRGLRITPKMVDTETYLWKIDDEDEVITKKKSK